MGSDGLKSDGTAVFLLRILPGRHWPIADVCTELLRCKGSGQEEGKRTITMERI